MKKRLITLLLGLGLILSLVACSNQSSQEASDQNEVAQETSEDTEKAEETEAATETEEATEAEESQEAEASEEDDSQEAGQEGRLMMATTTSTDNTGLLDSLAPKFKEDTGIELEWVAVGTGEALKMGEDGQVDIVMVHSKASEEEFVGNGYGIERIPIMYNDYVVVGPVGSTEKSEDAEAFFQMIADDELAFVSRGDDSGTHKKELAIWESVGMDPTSNPNYLEVGQGMGATLSMAAEEEALTLSDRATWLTSSSSEQDMSGMGVLLENDPILFNQYGVIAVNPEVHDHVNQEAAQAFIDWIVSDKIQDFIGSYGEEEFGQPLFVPNADDPEA